MTMVPIRTRRLVLALSLLISVSAICEGLLCFKCTFNEKETDNSCYDPKKNQEQVEIVECSKDEVCIKESQGGGKFRRDCDSATSDGKDKCEPMENPTRCYCSKDLCNAQPGTKLALGSGGSSVLKAADRKISLLAPFIIFAFHIGCKLLPKASVFK